MRIIRPGWMGGAPQLESVRFSPLYDLVNTRAVIDDRSFALPVNGKQVAITGKDIAGVAQIWGMTLREANQIVNEVAAAMRRELDGVVASAPVAPELSARFGDTVRTLLSEFK